MNVTETTVRPLVERLYAALGTGDRAALTEVLHPNFEGNYSPGLPEPIGGRHVGAQACITEGWWAIGALWSMRAKPERWLDCGPGELLVTGQYEGTARATGRPVNAPFAHLWSASEGTLRTLHQYTDTALWRDSLEARS
ncbi:nuclear transport factor 2 family protein [Pseudonocardia spinosispora]|uniref:nuclear transport factor 2 family protein n=1 Tax=Pseudonocardia spinosispora TaxID=103441 RepID=UPI000563E3CF|nr:nuclear transport factor 2 family protein [Pseudonocardia spinosispora]